MSLRRLHHTQPESFAYTPANQAWAAAQISKYPEGRQASAVIPLLWRGQEQEGWVTRPMIETVAGMLDMAQIRVLEVATFYFMFYLQPIGSVAHIQVCGTTSCMICGAEDLVGLCKSKIAPNPHELSPDGKFSWEEVECLGACSNAPMAQIGKDYYEDLTVKKLELIINTFAKGEVPVPGPQNGRYASEPIKGLTSLKDKRHHDTNASITLAMANGDTVARITGDLVPAKRKAAATPTRKLRAKTKPPAEKTGAGQAALLLQAKESKGRPKTDETVKAAKAVAAEPADDSQVPTRLKTARGGKPDDLKLISGVGPKLEGVLNSLGFYHFDQIAAWTSADIAWVDARLKFKGRIERDGWIDQARTLCGKG
ncbi:MAG TPA: NADH-quinone oxidoreductase subunit E [Thermohalobaculum sp.]|nr:NADH-quinone oxidoreductase subunit E [Thermohalobaculum sp.]